MKEKNPIHSMFQKKITLTTWIYYILKEKKVKTIMSISKILTDLCSFLQNIKGKSIFAEIV